MSPDTQADTLCVEEGADARIAVSEKRIWRRGVAQLVYAYVRDNNMPYFTLHELPRPESFGCTGLQQLARCLTACTATFDHERTGTDKARLYAVKPALVRQWGRP